MKYKNYLVRVNKEKFILCRGTALENDSSLAIVQGWSEHLPQFRYAIIDIASGLFVIRAHTKTKLLTKWSEVKVEYYPRIESARVADRYHERCMDLEKEIGVWKESGYLL